VPAALLLVGSAALLSKAKTVHTFLQLVGAVCLTVAVLAHVSEALARVTRSA
jgi:threonine/homoserine/homoserine lactone efflux protein